MVKSHARESNPRPLRNTARDLPDHLSAGEIEIRGPNAMVHNPIDGLWNPVNPARRGGRPRGAAGRCALPEAGPRSACGRLGTRGRVPRRRAARAGPRGASGLRPANQGSGVGAAPCALGGGAGGAAPGQRGRPGRSHVVAEVVRADVGARDEARTVAVAHLFDGRTVPREVQPAHVQPRACARGARPSAAAGISTG